MCSSDGVRIRSRSRDKRSAREGASDSIVPIIDIAGLFTTDALAKASVARQIGQACEEIGFFCVVNHGVSQNVIDAAWHKSQEFFDNSTLEEKRAFVTEDEAKYPYGYSGLGDELLSRGKNAERANKDQVVAGGDIKEMFQIGPKDPLSGMPPRRMPSQPEGFIAAWDAYYEQMNSLARCLLGAFALALDLPEDWFESKINRHISALRCINYPDQTGLTVPPGAIRASAHTDYGTLTILKSGGPGLQVSKDKEVPVWHDVPFIEDGFVINLGDLMKRWTNDRWSSTLHRVVNPPASEAVAWGRRMSLAFFHNLNNDAVVEAIPSCTREGRSSYAPIVAGEFLMLKHLASNGKADPDAHLKKMSSGG